MRFEKRTQLISKVECERSLANALSAETLMEKYLMCSMECRLS